MRGNCFWEARSVPPRSNPATAIDPSATLRELMGANVGVGVGVVR